MPGFKDIRSITELHALFRIEKPAHPLISVVDLGKVDRSQRQPGDSYRMNLYSITCKQVAGSFMYGRTSFDFSEGTLMFTAPDQVLTPGAENKVTGWAIYIHPDFFAASSKAQQLTGYSFFGYDMNEALHVSEAEKKILYQSVENIQREISLNLDPHFYHLIIANLELILSYSSRFYDRQFLTRTQPNNDLVARFDRLLTDYFDSPELTDSGLPGVNYFASRLNLSSNYLSDLLRKYTGRATTDHVYAKFIEKAKGLLWGSENSVSEIAYQLGFNHPSHFTKLFKSNTGVSPREFRNTNS